MAIEKPVWVAPDEPNEELGSDRGRSVAGSLSAATGLGRREQLVALRDRIATIIDSPDSLARDVASLSIRYMAVIKQIDELDAIRVAQEGDELDDAADSPDEGFDPSTV